MASESEPEVLFFFDSDALIQILLSDQQQLFTILLNDFSVSSFIMSEVEAEVRSNRKFGALVKNPFDAALKKGSLKILTAADLERLSAGLPAPVSLANIRDVGREYSLFVQKGEAYTHAAGIVLDSPTVSNDINAIKTLGTNSLKLPPKIFRSYDMFAFLLSEGYNDMRTSERILKTLKAHSEWIPKCLKHSSFEDGMNGLDCRLTTSLGTSSSSSGWSTPFSLKRKP